MKDSREESEPSYDDMCQERLNLEWWTISPTLVPNVIPVDKVLENERKRELTKRRWAGYKSCQAYKRKHEKP